MKLLLVTFFALFCYCRGLDTRIVGGAKAEIEQFPHQVSLQYIDSHNCGGAIVSPKFIVTAAHCTNEKVTKFLYVRTGTSLKDEGGVDYNITQIYQHPQFDPKTYDYDISVIELEKPIAYNKKTQPIKLPAKNSEVAVGTKCNITGWGYETENSHFTDHLQSVELPIVKHSTCNEYYKKFDAVITDRMMCAGFEQGGKDACQGDSGGPLIHNGQLVGVVSWGEGCGVRKQPGVFANVAYFRDYIREKTGL